MRRVSGDTFSFRNEDAWDVFFESGRRRSVPKATSGVEIVDLSSPSALLSAAAGCEEVLHSGSYR
jgi:hypothetical protein